MKPTLKVVLAVLAAFGALPFIGGDAKSTPTTPVEGVPVPPELVCIPGLDAGFLPPWSACHLTASALRTASRREAQDDFWVAVAKCRNGPGVNACIDEADDELDEAWDLINEQYAARLALCPLLGQGPYNPEIDPDDFSANVNNTFFPLVPGRMLIYRKMTPEGLEEVVVTHTNQIKLINGVPCRVVFDVVTLDGVLIEDTEDWYSQKDDGTVWYMGEIAKNFENGMLDNLDGSWQFGKEGAKPGIIMLAMPFVGAAYRQEFDPNNAEDVAKVISLGNTVMVMAGTFPGCLETEDFSPLDPDPDATERKFFAPGIGPVKEIHPTTGETLELFQIIN